MWFSYWQKYSVWNASSSQPFDCSTISGAFPSTDKQSTLLHGIMELDTLHHPSYRQFSGWSVKDRANFARFSFICETSIFGYNRCLNGFYLEIEDIT